MRILGRNIVKAAVAAAGLGTALAPVMGQPVSPVLAPTTQVAASGPATQESDFRGRPRAVASRSATRPVATSGSVTRPAATQPAFIRVDAPKHDFGRVWDSDAVAHTFEMVNTGDRPLAVLAVRPTCGCTTTDKWDKQVAPGATWQLPVKFMAANRRGKASKTILVDTDDPGARQVVFTLEGEVMPRFEMTSSVYFGPVRQETAAKRTIRITSKSDEPVQLKDAKVDLVQFHVSLREVEPGRRYELDVETVPPLGVNNTNSLHSKITVQTSLKDMPELTLNAYAYVQPRISLAPQVVVVPQPLEKTFRRRVVVKAMEGVTIHVKDVEVTNAQVETRVEPIQEGQEYSLWITVPAGTVLPSTGETLTVTTDDTIMPTLKATIRSMAATRPQNAVTGMSAADTQPRARPLGTRPSMRASVAPATQPVVEGSDAAATQPQ